MTHIFSEGKDLIAIIEQHDWLLYDVTRPTIEGRAFTWEELQEESPATQLEVGHNYLFVPKPYEAQTLRDAYSVTKGLGPSLTIDDTEDDRWLVLKITAKKVPGIVALFSRLFFEDDYVVASSPSTLFISEPDIVAMPYVSIVDSFRRYFRIVHPEEVDGRRPLTMPFISDVN